MYRTIFILVASAQCFTTSCRTMRSSPNEPIGSELSRSAPSSELQKNSDEKEVELKRQACEDLEESQNPQGAEKTLEIGIGKTLSGGSSKPYVGYRCKPK